MDMIDTQRLIIERLKRAPKHRLPLAKMHAALRYRPDAEDVLRTLLRSGTVCTYRDDAARKRGPKPMMYELVKR